MYKIIEFSHKDFGRMEVLIGEGNMMFSDVFLRKCLDVKNTQLPWCAEISDKDTAWIRLFEVFEYIRYAKVKEETRWDFEEWISDIIKDCSKLL